MSHEPTPDAARSPSAPPTVTCRVCGAEVPAGVFCGSCGATLSPQPGNGPDWLRPRAYGAAQGENLFRLSVTSSLFPHLAHRSRAAFRWGLAALAVALAVFAVLGWLVPLVTVSALGFPLLFLIYIEESDVYGDDEFPVTTLLLTAVLGAALGVGWALWTGPAVERSYPLLGNLPTHLVLQVGLAIPVGGAVVMVIPAVIVRLLRPKKLESLDGFLIGSLSAVAFTAASALVRLAPQLAHHLIDNSLPAGSFVVEAGIQGAAMPVTAAAVGGVVGAAVWYTWPEGRRSGALKRFVRAVLPAVVVSLCLYAGTGLIDIALLPNIIQLLVHLLIAAVAVLALRVGIHLALLNETREEMSGAPVVCAECHHVVDDLAFCSSCGVATHASSRSSRRSRRLAASTADDTASERTLTALPQSRVSHTSHARLSVILVVGLAAVIGIVFGVRAVVVKPPPVPHCPQDCGPPIGPPGGILPGIGPGPPVPSGLPHPPPGAAAPSANRASANRVSANSVTSSAAGNSCDTGPAAAGAPQPIVVYPRFCPDDQSFTVAYPADSPIHRDPNGVSWTDVRGVAKLFGVSAPGLTAQQVVDQFVTADYPNAKVDYAIPNAQVGYQSGAGEFVTWNPQTGSGPINTLRGMVMVAVKNGLALVAEAKGPFYWPKSNNEINHGSGANLLIAFNIAYYVNSFMWKGDPPR
jgi:hypothetical protein